MTGPEITAVGVVVPAHDEQERIGACLMSIRRALAALPDEIAVAVVVVLDRCGDATPQIVGEVLADWPQATAVPAVHSAGIPGVSALSARPRGRGVGAVRDVGVRDVLARLAGHRPAGTWLLSTDADTTVPADWALRHLACAAEGAHGVQSQAELSGRKVRRKASDSTCTILLFVQLAGGLATENRELFQKTFYLTRALGTYRDLPVVSKYDP